MKTWIDVRSTRPAELRPEPDELRPAVADVAWRLTHDLSDTPDDLRDALAFAPLAAVKAVAKVAGFMAARPRRTAAAVAGAFAMLRRRR